MITHNRFFVEALTICERPIRISGAWVAYKNREAKEFKFQTEALEFSQFVEFVDGESQEQFMGRHKKWQDDVLDLYLNLLAKEYSNVSMKKIKEIVGAFLNDSDHLKVLDIVSDAVEQSRK